MPLYCALIKKKTIQMEEPQSSVVLDIIKVDMTNIENFKIFIDEEIEGNKNYAKKEI